jgi:O-acetylhomoserine (thiol)-lyase
MSNPHSGTKPHLGFATRAVHAGAAPHVGTGARVTPIFHTNGFVFEDHAHGADIFALRRPGFSYSRGANPTTATLERRVADLEGGTAAIAVGSGQSALLMILMTLCESGDDYVATTQSFGGSRALMNRLAKRLKIGVNWVDGNDHAAVAAAIGPRTKGIMIESIVNPTGEVMDLTALAAIAKAHRLPLVVDNTLATPALLRPIEHGADIVWHSASKFMNGSGTAIGGIIVDAGRFNWAGDARFALISEPWDDYDGLIIPDAYPATAFATACRLIGLRELGPGLSPTNAFLILTGIETLHLRMPRHCENGARVAEYLASHPAVSAVSFPGLAGHANHSVAKRICPDGVGSIFVVTLKGGEAAAVRALSRFKLFSHLVNLGEMRSLVAHPASTTHRQLSADERAALGISDGTLRLSIGLENIEDLIADLDLALAL